MPSTCFLITDCTGDKALYWRYLYNYCINAGFGRELAALVNSVYGVSIKEEDIVSFTRSNYGKGKTGAVMEGILRNIISGEEYCAREAELFLSFDDIERLKADPLVSFGIHTRTHPVMKGLGDEELYDELAGSAAFYRSRIEDGAPMFSVPFGRLFRDYDERTVLSALDLSFGAIFSAYGGGNEKGQPRYNIRRIPVHEGVLEAGAEKFVQTLSEIKVGVEYRQAEDRLRDAVGHRPHP
jgi:hypothetical protein